jgi:hypothetical protein
MGPDSCFDPHTITPPEQFQPAKLDVWVLEHGFFTSLTHRFATASDEWGCDDIQTPLARHLCQSFGAVVGDGYLTADRPPIVLLVMHGEIHRSVSIVSLSASFHPAAAIFKLSSKHLAHTGAPVLGIFTLHL